MTRLYRPSLFKTLLAIGTGLSMLATEIPRPASAQERRTILDLFFGTRERRIRNYDDPQLYDDPPIRRQSPQQEQPRIRKPRQQAAPKTVEPPPPIVVEKLDNAKKVLVVGDFIAASLGDGLKTAFEDTPGIVIETRANGSSGIVRDDYFNWPRNLATALDEIKPALVIVSLGANDRQQMKVGDGKEKFRSPLWTTEYTGRVAALAAQARRQATPLLWVGMPSFPSSAMTADMVTLNGLFRTEAEKAGGQFIDIWDGFVDEAGKFVFTGSDINGQQVRLRGGDGITLTKAGKRKLAFYVEKDIRRLLGDAASSDTEMPDAKGLRDIALPSPTASEDIRQTPPIAFTDPELDGGSLLLGDGRAQNGSGKTPRDLLVEQGKVAEAPAGRVDDFRLAKPDTVISNPVIRN